MKTFPAIILVMALLNLSACGGGEAPANNPDNPEGTNLARVDLQCNGIFYGYAATVTGTRTYQPTGPLDGYIRFQGQVVTAIETAPLVYEDYSNLGPYEGTLSTISNGDVPVSVLDATGDRGDQMIIYLDIPSSGPPTILGQLTCI